MGRILPPLAGLAISVLVFRGALGLFFSQDDFAALARAAGLLPRFVEPWRWLSLQGYFDLMAPLAGRDPTPYHAVSLALHAAIAALLAVLLARAVSPPAALVGAAFFAAHAASFTAVYWISTIGDLGALLLSLAALAAALRPSRWRWLAPPLYAAALLCKESVILWPAGVAAVSAWSRGRRPGDRTPPPPVRDSVIATMTVVALAYAAYFVRANDVGLEPIAAGGAPYAARFGPHMAANALTYLGWTLNAFLPTVRGWTDAVDPAVHPWGWAALALAVAGCFSARLRRRGWIAAGLGYGALLLPVLPLAHHTYHYYLLAPLAAAAWGVAALFDAVAAGRDAPASRRDRGRSPDASPKNAAWVAATAVAVALAWNGALLVRKIETAPFMHPDLRAEPVVDRARIARNAIEGLERAGLPPGIRLVFWLPEARATLPADGDTAGIETYWERNVRSALYDGVAVRVWFPDLGSVAFSPAPPPVGESSWVAVCRVTGTLDVVRSAELDSMLQAAAP